MIAKGNEIDFRANLKNVKSDKFKLEEEKEVRFVFVNYFSYTVKAQKF